MTKARKPFATGDAVLRAYGKAVKGVLDGGCTASSQSAGFVDGPDGKVRLQVFVEVCAYSEDLLKKQPLTGGLLKLRRRRAS